MSKGTHIKIFFACSFNEKIKTTVNKIFNRIKKVNDFQIEKYEARNPEDSLFEGIINEINSSDAFVGIITEKSIWPMLETLISKLSPTAKDNKTYLFIDSKVKNRDIFREITSNVFIFDNENIEDIYQQIDYVIGDLLKLTDDFHFSKSTKKVHILKSGSGVVSYYHDLHVSSNPNAILKAIEGEFIISHDALKRFKKKLPSFLEMRDPKINSFDKPGFTCRITSNNNKKPVSIVDVNGICNRSKDHKCEYNIILNRWLTANEDLAFAWGFTFPFLYKTKGKDYTSYTAIHATSLLDFEVSFEVSKKLNSTVNFKQQPYLQLFDKNGKVKGKPINHNDMDRGLCFTKFVWKKIPDISRGERVKISWER